MPEILQLRPNPKDLGSASDEFFADGADEQSPSQVHLTAPSSSLFDRCWRQYALCREYLFTDHTRQIASAIQPMLNSPMPRSLVEAGCGPGFYSRRLAARFPQLQITGIDLSERLLYRAREHARRSGLQNCRFLRADALSLADFPSQVDVVVASRLFLILAEPALALDAIFTALRPGGLCFIAEPTSTLSAAMPLLLMKLTEWLDRCPTPLEELPRSRILSMDAFESLVETQPWRSIRIWKDRQYHCAVCKKAA
jgi:ubiquinone/menaquinone biosynthesis C-methylase UbiE